MQVQSVAMGLGECLSSLVGPGRAQLPDGFWCIWVYKNNCCI